MPIHLTRWPKNIMLGVCPPHAPWQPREKIYRRDLPSIGKFRDQPHVPLPPSFLLLNSSTGLSIVRGLDSSLQFYAMHNLDHASFLSCIKSLSSCKPQRLRKFDLLDAQKVLGIAQTALTTHQMLLAENQFVSTC